MGGNAKLYLLASKKSGNLSDCAISQLRFFTMYVLYRSWDDTQLLMGKFDEYRPYVPSKQDTWTLFSTMPDLKQKIIAVLMYSSGLSIWEGCSLCYGDVDRKNLRFHISATEREEQAHRYFLSLQT